MLKGKYIDAYQRRLSLEKKKNNTTGAQYSSHAISERNKEYNFLLLLILYSCWKGHLHQNICFKYIFLPRSHLEFVEIIELIAKQSLLNSSIKVD